MTPFLQFRVWLRRGPRGERVAAALAVTLLIPLLAWALVPVDDDSADGVLASGAPAAAAAPAPSAAPAEGSGPAAAAPGEGGGEAGPADTGTPGEASAAPSAAAPDGTATAPASGSQPADACAGLGATDQGVTPSEIFVAVSLINLAGDVGNETFGIRPDLEAVAHATAAGINAEGGLACRKLRIKTYRVNPLNQNEQRATCLEMVSAEPFAVVDFASYLDPVARSCFPEHKLPYQGATSMAEEEAAGGHPFLYSVLASTDRQLRNWVFEAAARRAFEPKDGFRKLGLLLNACNPKVNDELRQNLTKVGVGDDQRSTFTLRCASVAPPNEISQAVLQHRQDDVSHVLLAAPVANAQSYVRNAHGLRWTPTYMASDFGSVTNSSPAADWSDSFDKTVGITSQRGGELNSGIVSPHVTQCQEWMKKANVPPPTTEGDGALAFCDMFRLLAAAANAAGPGLVRTTLLDGLAKVGHFESAGFGDGIYDRPGKVTGGDFIRAIRWHLDCRCWKVLDRDVKPGH